jgi:MarR family transcriptional regulator, 2-MHQ and catechol-resistance regulon repressor
VLADPRESFYQNKCQELGRLYPQFDRLSAEVMLNLLYTCDVAASSTGKFLSKYGLAKSSFNILMNLRHGPPEGMLLHDLGELLLMTRANVTGLIDHLEEKGLVRRIVDASDRRARFARITKKGEALMDELVPHHFARTQQRLAAFTEDEKQTLVALLKKLRSAVRQADARSGEVPAEEFAVLSAAVETTE